MYALMHGKLSLDYLDTEKTLDDMIFLSQVLKERYKESSLSLC